MSVLEIAVADLTRQISRELEISSAIHSQLADIVTRVDERQRQTDLRMARLIGGGSALFALVQLIAPSLRAALGLDP